jgi:hypothetical protein
MLPVGALLVRGRITPRRSCATLPCAASVARGMGDAIRKGMTNPPRMDLVRGTLAEERPIAIPHGGGYLTGSLATAPRAEGVALVAEGRGCSRHSSSERELTAGLRRQGFSTVIADLLLPVEAGDPDRAAWTKLQTRELAARIGSAREWIRGRQELSSLPLVLFGRGACAAATLLSAEGRPAGVSAIVAIADPASPAACARAAGVWLRGHLSRTGGLLRGRGELEAPRRRVGG